MRAFVFLSCCFLISQASNAYEVSTHDAITRFAINQSVLGKSGQDIVSDRLQCAPKDGKPCKLPLSFKSEQTIELAPIQLIAVGARGEDEGDRPLNHFFDPQQPSATILPRVELSPNWALEDRGQVSNQSFSYSDAKAYLYKALTSVNGKEFREDNLGKAFKALGHVIHHLQDMHQPQHTRNDDHCSDDVPYFTFSAYNFLLETGSRCQLLFHYRPSAYEEYVADLGRNVPWAGYPIPDYGTFDVPRKLWEGSGRGSAEFTSNNFVSIRTNFSLDTSTRPISIRSDSEHPFPRGDDARLTEYNINDPSLVRRVTDPMPMAGHVSFVETPVIDHYAPLFSVPNPKSSALSIWYDSIVYNTGEIDARAYPVFTLNSINYQAALERLLPRAAAYSTGLINYFFRGDIEISLPERGVYGVVDHAQTSAGEGFSKLRLALRNSTPDGGGVPQEMPGGTLLAVAKYIRNPCYEDDLSGEFGGVIDYFNGTITPSGCPIAAYLSGQEQISVSAPIVAASLERGGASEIEFDFSHAPIPIDSRDVVLQVVYSGMLGEEADAVVVGAKNISEPTYLAVFNNSDYFQLDGQLYTPEEIRSDPALTSRVDFDGDGDVDDKDINIDPEPLNNLRFAIGDHYLTEPVTLDPLNYARIVVLADTDETIPVRVPSNFASSYGTNNTYNAATVETQLSREPYILSALDKTRGVHFWFMVFSLKFFGPGTPPNDVLKTLDPVPADPGPTPVTLVSP